MLWTYLVTYLYIDLLLSVKYLQRYDHNTHISYFMIYLTEPSVNPAINCLLKIRNTINTGIVAINVPARISEQSVEYTSFNVLKAICIVWTLLSFNTTSGHKKSFHAVINVKIPSVARPGLTVGNTILQKIRKLLQPSIRAASTKS